MVTLLLQIGEGRRGQPGRAHASHHLASGLMSCGWSQMKVGLVHCSSRNSPTSLSSSRAGVCGGGQLMPCFWTSSS